jgi:para-aminobenzoate synthetase component I
MLKIFLNQLGTQQTPFFFIIDFEMNNFEVIPFQELKGDIYFEMDNFSLFQPILLNTKILPVLNIKKNVSIEDYQHAFTQVQHEIYHGNTYLLNLTFPTEIDLNTDLLTIYTQSKSQFKLFYKNQLVSFSPERFIKIEHNQIKTYPMKGTIDASLENADEILLNDPKEFAEHTMVVDLLRNDLSMISKNVKVKRFRFLNKINAGSKHLLQMSSEIVGELEPNWHCKIGDILLKLLPAGSISGTPKIKTLEIIKKVEHYPRGFFTGIFGYFNGNSLDSAVMIRFIEKQNNRFFYKSGGGITIDSNIESEYKELLQKVYLPCNY